jgi:hypothetical protein
MPTPIEKLVLIEKITANIDNRYEVKYEYVERSEEPGELFGELDE